MDENNTKANKPHPPNQLNKGLKLKVRPLQAHKDWRPGDIKSFFNRINCLTKDKPVRNVACITEETTGEQRTRGTGGLLGPDRTLRERTTIADRNHRSNRDRSEQTTDPEGTLREQAIVPEEWDAGGNLGPNSGLPGGTTDQTDTNR